MIQIRLHNNQYEIATDPSRFKVVCAGRRFGKSVLSRAIVLNWASKIKNGLFWIVSPTYQMGKDIHWKQGLNIEIPSSWILKKNEADFEITLKNGSRIALRSAENPDRLRGVRLNGLIIDECAFIQKWDEVWKNALRPSLTDTQAPAVFISCVTKDTMIIGEKGLEEIGVSPDGYTHEEKFVYGLKGFQKAIYRYGSGYCPTKKIITKFGFEIECTPNHKLWTKDGWKRADNFKIGDQVFIQYNQQVFGEIIPTGFVYKKRKPKINFDTTFNEDLAYLLGLVLAEGCWTKYNLCITTGDKEIGDFLIKKYGFNKRGKYHYVLSSSLACEFLDWIGIPHGAKNKIIPEKIFQLPKKLLASFLSGYFDGDGSADSRLRVQCGSASEKLIKQLQILLLNFGILAKRSSYLAPPTKKVKTYSKVYYLRMENFSASRFHKEIGFRLKRKKKFAFDSKNTYKTYFDRDDWGKLPTKFGYLRREKKIEICTLEKLLAIQKNKKYSLNLITDEVKEIKDRFNFVYDFVIPKTRSYFSNGFISHNTPLGYNHFYDLYLLGQKGEKDWKSWRFTTYENPFIPKEEIEKAKKELDEDAFAQEYLAQFKKFTGLVIKSFKREVHVIEPQELPQDATYYRSIDFGFVNPTAVIFSYINNKGELIVYDEIYQKGLQTPDLANLILQKSAGRQFSGTFADSSQASDIAELQKYGIDVLPVKKSSGTEEDWTMYKVRRLVEKVNKNTLKITKNCVNLIWEIENYRYHEINKNGIIREIPLKLNDHLIDALTYLICSLPEEVEVKILNNQNYDTWIRELPDDKLFTKDGFF